MSDKREPEGPIFVGDNLLKALRKPTRPAPMARALPGGAGFEVEFPQVESPDPPVFEEVAARLPLRPPPFLAAALRSDSFVSEEFRILRAKVRALDEAKGFRCIGMVSCSPGEGKTSMSLGLSLAMARESGARVLLIESDLRRPSAEEYLNLPQVAGLAEWLEGTKTVVTLRRLDTPGFLLLSAGHQHAPHPEILRSPRMLRLLATVRRTFDYVIVDCPPLTPVADSVLLQDFMDGFLLVVRARHTSQDGIAKAVSHLKPDRIRGVIFNDHRELLTAYYRYGYGYYRRHAYHPYRKTSGGAASRR